MEPSTESDPYDTDVHRWWHLSGPSPELVAAVAEGFLPPGQRVLDTGCGLGSDLGWLHETQRATLAVGVDRSAPALGRMARLHPGVHAVRADVTSLPFPDARFDVVIDRGCFHYLSPQARRHYGIEAARVLTPGGRLFLRVSLFSAGRRNDVDEAGVRCALEGWEIVALEEAELRSDTRPLHALVVRARRPPR